jgi:hypothetical protein
MLTKKVQIPKLAQFAIPLTLLALTISMPSLADSGDDYKEVDAALVKVEGIAGSLNGIVGGMMTVTVSAAGGSAVFQLFRRMILSNL